jgi:hypothetical protein
MYYRYIERNKDVWPAKKEEKQYQEMFLTKLWCDSCCILSMTMNEIIQ